MASSTFDLNSANRCALSGLPAQQTNENVLEGEVKDERKETDGSPELKAKVRQKQREMSTTRMMEAIAEADVVITNPEHFAVCLAYDPFVRRPAPSVVAKGVGSRSRTHKRIS